MLFNKQSWQIGLYISQHTIACALVQGHRDQFKVACQAYCGHHDHEWLSFKTTASDKAGKQTLPVYISIDTDSLFYQRLTLPAVMSRQAVQHYVKKSVKELLGVENSQVYHDQLIDKTSSGYHVEIYGVRPRLYEYCQYIGGTLGSVCYMGPSDWVVRQCLSNWLPLKPYVGYILERGHDRYYWYQQPQDQWTICQHVSSDTTLADNVDANWHWHYLTNASQLVSSPTNFNKSAIPKVMQPLWQQPLPSVAAVTASL